MLLLICPKKPWLSLRSCLQLPTAPTVFQHNDQTTWNRLWEIEGLVKNAISDLTYFHKIRHTECHIWLQWFGPLQPYGPYVMVSALSWSDKQKEKAYFQNKTCTHALHAENIPDSFQLFTDSRRNLMQVHDVNKFPSTRECFPEENCTLISTLFPAGEQKIFL